MKILIITAIVPLKNRLELKCLETNEVFYFKPSKPVSSFKVGQSFPVKVG